MNKKILIFGSSGHARSITEILEELDYEIVGFIDSFAPVGSKVLNYEVLGSEHILAAADAKFKTHSVVIAVGENNSRSLVLQKLLRLNGKLEYPAIISPQAQVAPGIPVGRGTVIMKSAIVNANSRIGNFVILNTAAVVEHDSVVDDFASLATGALLGGATHIGTKAFVGMGAQIIQKINIGCGSVVGAGSTVLADIPDNVLAVGSPAKIVKTDYYNNNIFS